jgi:hypothetical protein
VGEFVSGDGTSDAYRTYRFTDTQVPAVSVVYYCLEQVDLDGTTSRSRVIEVVMSEASVLPVEMALLPNYPNPFNPGTTIAFDVNKAAVVSLRVLDLSGQVVRTLVAGEPYGAGRYQVVWDGRNEQGMRVASGVYLYQLSTADFRSLRKMTLLQ